MEENWDSDEEEEERAVAAAGVVREEEEEPGGSDPRAPGIGSVFVLSFVRRMMSGAGAVRFLWFDYFGASHEFPWARFTNFFHGVLGCCHRALGGRQTG